MTAAYAAIANGGVYTEQFCTQRFMTMTEICI